MVLTTAPLTPNQAAAHLEIEQTGGTVVGQVKPVVLGHEGGWHGIFAINNPAQAVTIQNLLNEAAGASNATHFTFPPDVLQKIEMKDKR